MDLTFTQMIAAVFLGNLMAVIFVAAFRQVDKYKDAEHPWLLLAGLLFPLLFALAETITAVGLPPYLAALAAQ